MNSTVHRGPLSINRMLELLYYFTYFFTVIPSNSCVFYVGPFVVNTKFSISQYHINDERPTGKKHTTVGWDDSGKIGKIMNSFYLKSSHRCMKHDI